MRRWISHSSFDTMGASCSTHRDREAVAVLIRPKKSGRGVVNMRYYCDECLQRKIERDPEIEIY